MNTLFDVGINNRRLVIGKGLSINLRNTDIEIFKNEEFIEIKSISTDFAKRLAVVEMVNNYGAMKKRLSEVLDISRQTIDNWLDSFSKHGAEGLINSTKESWKKNPHRFKGNKARILEQDRISEAEKIEQQAISINFTATPKSTEDIKTGLFTDKHSLEDNRYAGSMLVIGMLEYLYGFHQMAATIYEEQIDFLYLFISMHINHIGSVEQLKTVNKYEFGRIIGQTKLSSLPNLWQEIHKGVDKKKSDQISNEIFNYQAANGLVSLHELFIDGHFIPYYGGEKVHKGFYTQRDLMLKGQTQMFVHDISGRVVYFETQEGKGDIVETLKRASERISKQNNGQKPLIAVDREVWGVENFNYLANERVVTWEKFSTQEELQEIDINLFTQEIKKNDRCWQLYEDVKQYRDAEKNQVTLRRIILHEQGKNNRLSLVTTDNHEKQTVIAETMLSRWASNENGFKFMGDRTNMHYNPAIEIAQESQNQEIDNPEYKEVHKKLTALKTKLLKTERQIGKIPVSENKNGNLRENGHRKQLQELCEGIKQEMQIIKDKLDNTSRRIDVSEINAEKFKVIDKEGINLWTTCEMLFWNSRKELIERFLQYLPNKRDTIPVLEALINAPGRIQSTVNMILVKLETLDTPRFNSAQRQLLRFMNNLGVHINGKLLQFDTMSN